jgi:hypothetical protein
VSSAAAFPRREPKHHQAQASSSGVASATSLLLSILSRGGFPEARARGSRSPSGLGAWRIRGAMPVDGADGTAGAGRHRPRSPGRPRTARPLADGAGVRGLTARVESVLGEEARKSVSDMRGDGMGGVGGGMGGPRRARSDEHQVGRGAQGADQRPAPRAPGQNERPAPRAPGPERPGPVTTPGSSGGRARRGPAAPASRSLSPARLARLSG